MDFYNKIAIASDHAGFELKKTLIDYLHTSKISIFDLGCDSLDSCDYPDFGFRLAKAIENKVMGILICGSGIGMSIAANRFKHIRAALCHTTEQAKLARQHNNANVLVLASRFITAEYAIEIIKAFMETEFEGGRHEKRVEKLSDIGGEL
ncbi:MAG: ribose 5-phosphate isomerase B [Alphaproteobacteria bacterium]|nr:ribose 5-phosphate isomerase B [Alphaproteobacteria bacterium]OJV17264.1 MAG: ribose 5-phosphate isomerase B [Alphaproteobacteria bacterium 33-17]